MASLEHPMPFGAQPGNGHSVGILGLPEENEMLVRPVLNGCAADQEQEA
jgi:hypothetical protein